MFNNKNQKIIFIHIPKTAGFAIARCLDKINLLSDGYGYSHSTVKDIINDTNKDNIILAVVRNPYDRLYSIYDFYRKKRKDIKGSVTFENFILTYEKKYHKKKSQFNTCYNFLTIDDELIPTDIIRFENLNMEYNKFCNKYNIENNLVVMNKNQLKNEEIDFTKLYTKEMQRVIEKIFKNDFKTFNYSYESFIESKINRNYYIMKLEKECYNKHGFYPISFSFYDKNKKNIDLKSKTKDIAHIIPGDKSTYIFKNEESYYEDYKKSKLAFTKMKAGWDCCRHLEIIFNNSLPIFENIEDCPEYTMIHYPKDLFEFINKNIEELKKNEKLYSETLNKLIKHAYDNLTCKSMINYIFKVTNLKPNKILFIDKRANKRSDYLSNFTHIGLKQIYGKDCETAFLNKYLYKNESTKYTYLWGMGFSYVGKIDSTLKNNINDKELINKIKNKYYDCIVFGSVSRSLEYFNLIKKYYDKNKIIGIFGEDKTNNKKFKLFINNLKKELTLFVREIDNNLCT